MAVEVRIPQLGVTMQEGELVEWLVADGATVSTGDPIYVLGTDKADNEIEAPADGVLRIKVQERETCEVGTLVAEIEQA
ncbi:lipoyl domain-containing protein [Actinoplanes sp. NPDC051851]|uniref:lipoyl domain-containing protein n=1 Tax=Actinoplanes sp. NPDC051851 TaxID=3154753 RepID=UPI003412E645